MDEPRSTFRRRIIVEADGGSVRAGVEDVYHHFELLLTHDSGRVTAIEGTARRTPWTVCPAALQPLRALVGRRIGVEVQREQDLPDPRQQCTHWFELALLAIAQAARGGRRQYDAAVPARQGVAERERINADGTLRAQGHTLGRTRATLDRDGAAYLSWDLDGETITAPSVFAGQDLRTLLAWAAVHCDPEMYEAVKVLRRVAHISAASGVPLDRVASAAQHPSKLGACFAFQPVRAAQALRNVGATRDFTARPDDLLQNFRRAPLME